MPLGRFECNAAWLLEFSSFEKCFQNFFIPNYGIVFKVRKIGVKVDTIGPSREKDFIKSQVINLRGQKSKRGIFTVSKGRVGDTFQDNEHRAVVRVGSQKVYDASIWNF